MKKAIVGWLLFASIIPFNSYAVTSKDVGIEFLSPLVQTIIGLLHDRIAVLSSENATLRAQVASCQPAQTTQTTQQTQQTQQTQPILGSIQTETTPTVVEIPQTVSISYVYRTDAPYVAPGNTQDRCPTFTITSDKQIFVEKVVFASPQKVQVDNPDISNVGSNKVKTFRKCFGDIYNQTTLQVTLVGAETLIYGANGVRIPIQDIVFTY